MDRRRRRAPARSLVIALPLLLAACGVAGGPTITPGPSPSSGPPLTAPELRLHLLAELGPLWYCDPDLYPVGRDEAAAAAEALPGIRADAETFAALVDALDLDPSADLDADERLAVYRAWKELAAIELTPIVGGFAFDELFGPSEPTGQAGERIAGTIGADGTIEIEARTPAGPPNCPICLARGTPILTPGGPVAVEDLVVGDVVWTLEETGRLVGGTVLVAASTAVPPGHRIVRLTLDDGRSVTASPGHPLADGRPMGRIRPGDRVDGARVVAADLVDYDGGRTFDLVVSGPTGTYLAGDGIPLASTIDRRAPAARGDGLDQTSNDRTRSPWATWYVARLATRQPGRAPATGSANRPQARIASEATNVHAPARANGTVVPVASVAMARMRTR
jgi:hypothetical protein